MRMPTVERVDGSRFRCSTLDAKLPAVESPPEISNSPAFVANQKYLNHSRPAPPNRDTYVVLCIEVIVTDVKHFLTDSGIVHQILTWFFYLEVSAQPGSRPRAVYM